MSQWGKHISEGLLHSNHTGYSVFSNVQSDIINVLTLLLLS